MKVLLDECAPRALKHFLAQYDHDCQTAQEAGWAGKQNGELLRLASSRFDAFVTLDTNLRYQQSLERLPIGVIVLHSRSNRLAYLSRLFPACLKSLETLSAGDVVHLE